MDTDSTDGGDGLADAFVEAPAPHGEAVMMVARGVGVLVAIAAVLFAILFMMVIRAFIGIILHKIGVSGVAIFVSVLLVVVTHLGGASLKLVWRIFSRSCC